MTNLSFTVGHATFHLTPNGDRLEWHTLDRQCRCGGNPGRLTYWATCSGIVIGKDFRTLGRAMRAAANFKELLGVRRSADLDPAGRPSASESGLVFDRVAA